MSETRSELFPDKYLVTHTITAAQGGMRLDAFLKEKYKRRSREQIKRAIESGAITLSRRQSAHLHAGRLKPNTRLIEGDEVQVLSERKPEPEVCFDYRVIHEDESILVIDKPANLPVHPAGAYFFNTLLVHLRTDGFRSPLRAEREYYLPHRIDKETSGILVLAKDPGVCAALTEQFRERTTEKRYLAIVHGTPAQAEFDIEYALKRDENSRVRLKMRVVTPDEPDEVLAASLPSLTRARVLGSYGPYSLVECFPKTGRQHQIRIHMAAAGHPLVGDKLYSVTDEEAARFYEQKTSPRKKQLAAAALRSAGEPLRRARPIGAPRPLSDSDEDAADLDDGAEGDGFGGPEALPAGNPSARTYDSLPPRYVSPELQKKLVIDRHALHAAGIRFNHPGTGKRMDFEAALAPDLAAFLSAQS